MGSWAMVSNVCYVMQSGFACMLCDSGLRVCYVVQSACRKRADEDCPNINGHFIGIEATATGMWRAFIRIRDKMHVDPGLKARQDGDWKRAGAEKLDAGLQGDVDAELKRQVDMGVECGLGGGEKGEDREGGDCAEAKAGREERETDVKVEEGLGQGEEDEESVRERKLTIGVYAHPLQAARVSPPPLSTPHPYLCF
jgi:hypothetical protein